MCASPFDSAYEEFNLIVDFLPKSLASTDTVR